MTRPAFLDAPVPEEYPFEETYDLRTGPDLHPSLLGLLPFVGLWRGRGSGEYPTIEPFEYAQELRISHDGRPFLMYSSRAWLVEPDGTPIRPSHREVGFWRMANDEVEALFTMPTGIQEFYLGAVTNVRLQMATAKIVRTDTAKDVTGGQRMYGIVERDLLYAHEMQAMGQPLTGHLAAKLTRVGG